MEMSASEPVPDNEEEDVEEAVPENKSTLANLAEGFGLFKTGFDLYLFGCTRPSLLRVGFL